jgi:hypothetical protein
MDTSILQIGTQGHLIYFTLFSFIIVSLAFVAYALLSSNRFRRPQFREAGTLSRASSILIVAPLAGLPLWYLYNDSWGHFFTLEIHDGAVHIGYYFPERTVSFGKDDIVSISTTSHIRRTGARYRLVIRLENTEEYTSQMINQQDTMSVVESLEKAINIEVRSASSLDSRAPATVSEVPHAAHREPQG